MWSPSIPSLKTHRKFLVSILGWALSLWLHLLVSLVTTDGLPGGIFWVPGMAGPSLLSTQLCCLGFLALLRGLPGCGHPWGAEPRTAWWEWPRGSWSSPSPATSPVGLSLAECECVCVSVLEGVSAGPTAQRQLLVVSDE